MKKIINFTLLTAFALMFCVFSFSKNLVAHAHVTTTDTVPSRKYTVVIDPGHGGLDVK